MKKSGKRTKKPQDTFPGGNPKAANPRKPSSGKHAVFAELRGIVRKERARDKRLDARSARLTESRHGVFAALRKDVRLSMEEARVKKSALDQFPHDDFALGFTMGFRAIAGMKCKVPPIPARPIVRRGTTTPFLTGVRMGLYEAMRRTGTR